MVVWVIQILLACAFGVAGVMKLVTPKVKLEANAHMGWIAGVPEAQVKLLAMAELLGALGLIRPVVTGIAPLLVRVAAACRKRRPRCTRAVDAFPSAPCSGNSFAPRRRWRVASRLGAKVRRGRLAQELLRCSGDGSGFVPRR